MHSCYFAIYAILKLLYYYIHSLIHSGYFAINAILLLLNYIVVLCTTAILLLMLFCYLLLLNYYSHIYSTLQDLLFCY